MNFSDRARFGLALVLVRYSVLHVTKLRADRADASLLVPDFSEDNYKVRQLLITLNLVRDCPCELIAFLVDTQFGRRRFAVSC